MELKKYKLGELLSKIENGAVIKQNKGAKGIPITRIETLSNGLFNRDKLGYADIEDPTLYSDYILEDNDLLMSHINSKEFVGRTVIYKKQANECIIHGMNLLRIKTNTKLLDPEFAYYYFQTDTIKKSLYNLRKDAIGQSSIAISDIKNMVVAIPSISIQKEIAFVLRCYDRKLDVNSVINQNLEAMAKQLYDYWFVQFDFPNEDGKPYKSSGGAMVWNEKLKRRIPEGWNVMSINEICTSCRGVSYGKDDLLSDSNGVLVLRGNNIENNRIVYDSNVAFVPNDFVSEEQHIKEGDIIMTMSSGSKAHVGKCAMFHKDSEHTFGAFLSKFTPKKELRYMTFLFLTSEYFKSLITAFCNGTGINNLTNQTFDDVLLVLPDKNKTRMFESKVNNLFTMIGNNEENMRKLTKQRDELLPLLMNGQVSVNSDLLHD